MITFHPVKNISRGLSPYSPLFKNNQKTPLNPYVNQLANGALINPNRSCNDPCDGPKYHNGERPRSKFRPASLGHAIPTSEQTHIYIFRRNMAVDDARDDDCRDCNSIRAFAEEWGCGAQSWRCVVGTCVALCYGSHDQIHGSVAAFKQVKSFGVGFRVFKPG